MANNPSFSDELSENDKTNGTRRNVIFALVAALVCILVVPFGEWAYFAYFLIPIFMYVTTKKIKAAHQD
jgi:hypothetical protein